MTKGLLARRLALSRGKPIDSGEILQLLPMTLRNISRIASKYGRLRGALKACSALISRPVSRIQRPMSHIMQGCLPITLFKAMCAHAAVFACP